MDIKWGKMFDFSRLFFGYNLATTESGGRGIDGRGLTFWCCCIGQCTYTYRHTERK